MIIEFFLIVQIFLLSTINNRGWHYKIDFDDYIFVNIFNTLPTIPYNVKNNDILVGASILYYQSGDQLEGGLTTLVTQTSLHKSFFEEKFVFAPTLSHASEANYELDVHVVEYLLIALCLLSKFNFL